MHGEQLALCIGGELDAQQVVLALLVNLIFLDLEDLVVVNILDGELPLQRF